MIKRIVEISTPSRLSLKDSQLVIEREGSAPASVPVEDLGVLILDHAQTSATRGILSACLENNVAVVISDAKHLPGAILLPLEGNSLHAKTIKEQIRIKEPVKKRLWQTIVQAKIRAQAKVLALAIGKSNPLHALASRVRSGDPGNIEAQAARIYWRRLFGEAFRRDVNAPGTNAMLNYGYAVMRAAIARAVVSTGLHPSLGIHHRNQYNSLCLADDLVETLRPAVDMKVFELCGKQGEELFLTPEVKHALLEVLSHDCTINGTSLPLMTALHHYAASVRRVICGEDKGVEIPEL